MKNKIKKEQLEKINKHQEAVNSILHQLGYLESQKHGLLHELGGVNEEIEKFKNELEKEYGPININVEDGTYTVIEKEDE
tara:strand:+ start:3402 stop:3641 length:240 start_codon:yes stop_codon:yes gene_type:complete